MNQEKYLYRVTQLLSRFREQVKILSANGEFSINIHAENILIKILNILYDCELENVNYKEGKNYPSIDLRDKNGKVAFQITSTANLEKIKHTLDTFKENKLYENFSELYIYIITEKQKSYDQTKINDITQGKFNFQLQHIIDRSDIYIKLNEKNDIKIIKEVLNLLEDQFADEKKYTKWDKYYQGLESYDEYIVEKLKYLDIRGFSPRIDNRQVKISLEKVYIPLNIVSETSCIDSKDKDSSNKLDMQSKKLEDAIDEHNRIMILGDPGSGKTTLLKHINYLICKDRAINTRYTSIIPVLIRCADYSKFYETYQKGIAEYLIDHFEKKYELLFLEGLEQGNLIILLDGLDEINDIQLRHDTVRQIDNFIAQCPQIKVVGTSRKVGYQETRLSGHFMHYEVQDFNKEQINDFALSWYLAIAEDSDNDIEQANKNAKSLISSISRNKSVIRLAKNPLLITIIALINYKGTALPEKRIDLYEAATFTFLENWVNQRRNARKITFDKNGLIEILSPIAFYMHTNYSDGLISEKEFNLLLNESYNSIYPYIETKEMQKDIRDIIDFIREDAGFIFEKGRDGHGNSLFGFVHLTFQEYFASIEFATKWKEGSFSKELSYYIFNSNWHEIILLAASQFRLSEQPRIGRQKASEFIEDIFKANDIFPELNRPLKLVIRILLEEIDIKPDLFENIINNIFTILTDVIDENPMDNYKIQQKRHFSFQLGELIKTRIYGKFILERLLGVIDILSDKQSISILMDVLIRSSKTDCIKKALIEILQGDNIELKKCIFEYSTIWPIAEIIKTKVFKKEIVSYVNGCDFINIQSTLPTQYIYSFLGNYYFDLFMGLNYTSKNNEQIIADTLHALKEINDEKIREKIAAEVIDILSLKSIDTLINYKDKLLEQFPKINVDKINKEIKRSVIERDIQLKGSIIARIKGTEIFYEMSGDRLLFMNEESFSSIDVEYPVINRNIKLNTLLGNDTDEIILFLNLIYPFVVLKEENLSFESTEEFELFIKYMDKLTWKDNLRNKSSLIFIKYLFQLPLNEEIIKKNFANLYFLSSRSTAKETKLMDDDKLEEFIMQIQISGLEVFQKLHILNVFGKDNEHREYINPTIELFRSTKDDEMKNSLFNILDDVMEI